MQPQFLWCQTEFIYISQVDACIQIHDINNVKLIIIMKMVSEYVGWVFKLKIYCQNFSE